MKYEYAAFLVIILKILNAMPNGKRCNAVKSQFQQLNLTLVGCLCLPVKTTLAALSNSQLNQPFKIVNNYI